MTELAWDALVRLLEPAARATGPEGLVRLARRTAPGLLRALPGRRASLRAVARDWMGLRLDPTAERELLERALAEECARQAEILLGRPRAVPVEGFGVLEAAHRCGRGVVLVTCHAGPHHRAGLALAARGLRVFELGLAPAAVDRVLERPSGLGRALRRHGARARRQEPVVHLSVGPGTGHASLRRALRALAEGGVVVVPGDGLWARSTLTVPLLAGRARLPTGPARLARRAGSPLVFGALAPAAEGWVLGLGPAREPPASSSEVLDAVRAYGAWLEAQVRAQPALHLWRWATIHRLQARGLQDFFQPDAGL